jgi:glycosyltransferase involved in cell wall biosynthesis
MENDGPGAIAFVWEQFSAYHIDRLEALGRAGFETIGIEIASRSKTYAWAAVPGSDGWTRDTLFPDAVADDVPWTRKVRSILHAVRKHRIRHIFFCNNEQPEILAAVPLLRIMGCRVYAMLDGKFDDHPRSVLKEWLKPLVLRQYNGAIIAGKRHADYYRFLGLPAAWAATAYDTVSIDRIRRAAGADLAPGGKDHGNRDFLCVARFVDKKNLHVAIDAFARFVRDHPALGTRFRLAGSGVLEGALREQVARHGLQDRVEFLGFLGADAIAREMASSLALVLPSIEEQWGLVVNEAVALNLPILCSENVGARDTLVRNGVNGFVFEPDNPDGLAFYMHLLASDPVLWAGMCRKSAEIAPLGDVSAFVDGIGTLVGSPAPAAPLLRSLRARHQ